MKGYGLFWYVPLGCCVTGLREAMWDGLRRISVIFPITVFFSARISVSCSMAISHSVSWIVDNSGLLRVSFRRKLLESCFRKLMSSMPPNRSGSLLPQNPTVVNYVNGWKGFAGVSFLVFSKIVFPLIKPAIVTACIFSFMWRWDDFLSALLYVSKYLVEGISTSGLKG
jgi:hypothetical protein